MNDYTEDELWGMMFAKYMKEQEAKKQTAQEEEEMTDEERAEMDEEEPLNDIPVTESDLQQVFCPKTSKWSGVSKTIYSFLLDHYDEIDGLPDEVVTYFKNKSKVVKASYYDTPGFARDLVRHFFIDNPNRVVTFSYLMCNLREPVTTANLEYALRQLSTNDDVASTKINGQIFWYAPKRLKLHKAKLCTPTWEKEGF